MEHKKHFDFLTSLVLIAVSAYIAAAGFGIYQDAGEPMYVSPGLFPIVLGIALALCSVFLLLQSLKGGGASARCAELKQWAGTVLKEPTCISMLIGTLIMGIYTYLLLSLLPFWLASLLFMILLMMYLNSGSVVKILLISGGAVAGVVALFQVLFRVPLP